MSSWEHIEYGTKLVTIPIVTARDREYPDRIGPWRIRRTQSEPNSSVISSSEQDHQSELTRLLTKVDEQCLQIDSIIKLDTHQLTEAISEKDRVNDIEKGATFKGTDPIFPRNIWFFWLWLLCIVIVITNYIAVFRLVKLLSDSSSQRPSKAELYTWMAACGFASGWGTAVIILLVMAVELGRRITRRALISIVGKGLVFGFIAGCLVLGMVYQMF